MPLHKEVLRKSLSPHDVGTLRSGLFSSALIASVSVAMLYLLRLGNLEFGYPMDMRYVTLIFILFYCFI